MDAMSLRIGKLGTTNPELSEVGKIFELHSEWSFDSPEKTTNKIKNRFWCQTWSCCLQSPQFIDLESLLSTKMKRYKTLKREKIIHLKTIKRCKQLFINVCQKVFIKINFLIKNTLSSTPNTHCNDDFIVTHTHTSPLSNRNKFQLQVFPVFFQYRISRSPSQFCICCVDRQWLTRTIELMVWPSWRPGLPRVFCLN